MAEIKIEIQGLKELQQSLRDYPKISAPILQRAVKAVPTILLKHTTRETVPWRTGNLAQTFGWEVGQFWSRFFPKANYAVHVEFGTKPHVILYTKPGRGGLYNKDTGQGFGRRVNHPGTRPNPFMERIVKDSEGEINKTFLTAIDLINKEISNRTNIR